MITQADAEALAKKLIEEYVNACDCDSNHGVGNVLMKLVSVAGISMCAAVGQPEAVSRMEGTTRFIARQEFARWTQHKAN